MAECTTHLSSFRPHIHTKEVPTRGGPITADPVVGNRICRPIHVLLGPSWNCFGAVDCSAGCRAQPLPSSVRSLRSRCASAWTCWPWA